MKDAVTVEEMREYDRYTIENLTDSKTLMLRAAQGIFDSYDFKGKKTAIVCGSGNNGGDGYALAGILQKNGESVDIFKVSEKFSEDGKYYFNLLRGKEVGVFTFTEEVSFSGYDVVVDCIFGTGFSGEPKGICKTAIEKINDSGAYVISADINSGLNGNTGEAAIAVKSDLTVSIGFYKVGMFAENAKNYIKSLVNVDIGIVKPDLSHKQKFF